MDKLSPFSVGFAAAITLALVNVLCAVAVALWPNATFDFFGAFMHGLDLSTIKSTAPFDLGRALYGLIGLGVIGFVAGVVFATAYNLVRAR